MRTESKDIVEESPYIRKVRESFLRWQYVRDMWFLLRSIVCWWRDPWHGTAYIWKQLGKTPLEEANAFRARGIFVRGRRIPIPEHVPIAYAGRLDPMAEGVLLLLFGDTCKEIVQYREHDKTYVVEILLGVSTDTGDLLGITKESAHSQDYFSKKSTTRVLPFSNRFCSRKLGRSVLLPPAGQTFSRNNLAARLQEFVGTHEWEYPVFSSKTVKGRPLFRWYYEGRIGEIVVPRRTMSIYCLRDVHIRTVTAGELFNQIQARIAQVTPVTGPDKDWGNDFRRQDVLAVWKKRLAGARNDASDNSSMYTLVTIKCRCSSGTYMRTLAEKIGDSLGVPACAYSITRLRVG